MAVLRVVGLDAAFSQDPAITLMNFIKDNYTISTPAKADVNFDTKFARGDFYNHVIIENLKKTLVSQTLGDGRFRYDVFKRVQIWCGGTSDAKNNAYLISEHIEDIINANPIDSSGLQDHGVNRAHITDFTEIATQPAPTTDEEIEVKSTNVFRLTANVKMVYYKYKF